MRNAFLLFFTDILKHLRKPHIRMGWSSHRGQTGTWTDLLICVCGSTVKMRTYFIFTISKHTNNNNNEIATTLEGHLRTRIGNRREMRRYKKVVKRSYLCSIINDIATLATSLTTSWLSCSIEELKVARGNGHKTRRPKRNGHQCAARRKVTLQTR